MASSDDFKRQRTSAKGRFTRFETSLLNKLDEPFVTSDLIKTIYDDICAAWKKVVAKHDCYVDAHGELANGVECDNDAWIKEIQDRFYEAQWLVNSFQEWYNSKMLIENAHKVRDISYNNFRVLCINIETVLNGDVTIEQLERERIDINIQLNDVKSKHND